MVLYRANNHQSEEMTVQLNVQLWSNPASPQQEKVELAQRHYGVPALVVGLMTTPRMLPWSKRWHGPRLRGVACKSAPMRHTK